MSHVNIDIFLVCHTNHRRQEYGGIITSLKDIFSEFVTAAVVSLLIGVTFLRTSILFFSGIPLPLGSRLWCLTASLSLYHWYPGSGVALDCTYS